MVLSRKWNYKRKMLPPARSAFVLPTGTALAERTADAALCRDLQGPPTFPRSARVPPDLTSVLTHVWLRLGHWSGDEPSNMRKCHELELTALVLPLAWSFRGSGSVAGAQDLWVRLVPPRNTKQGLIW